MQEDKLCPYPGLRPFNDDEAIFFKGRDKNIDSIIALFEQRKFMMLTGASGDGKSSLVYAGVVPNARAGLFKAKYNSWAIADFRPERSPLKNLTSSLSDFFPSETPEELSRKLSYGFSSLVTIYKNSDLYINPESDVWKQADEAARKQLKRKASNLLIIADQFEEFFTNPENYQNGVASVESKTVVNLLLETAKIALAEDLPIYIICTMRSDYIGQCSAFRDLPEYIGFSHFFVPRLKRNEIGQVIEQPALFNGDKISSRLIERLLSDIGEGHDQLPILQHAMNQIWKIAKNGEEEMDLIHYAMVGGLPKDQLLPADQQRLAEWMNGIPEFKKRLLEHPSLENILNAHADELLETAFDTYAAAYQGESNELTEDDTLLIIRTAFQCLTKIDNSRAIRNRMTVQEITDIINQAHITAKIVGEILNTFRKQGNTFIKPFITGEGTTISTSGNTVLDITHESLIRNWNILKTWADEEYENLLTWQDFNKQLQRWVQNERTKGYLLPIGPLTFFENWFNSVKPNKYWLIRYDEREISEEEKEKDTEKTLIDARQFIRQSSRNLFVSRTIIKYGVNKLLTIIGIAALIGLCVFYYFDFQKKQNTYVINQITERGIKLLSSDKIHNTTKAHFLINQERLNPGSSSKLLNNLHNDTLAFDIAFEEFMLVQNYDYYRGDTLAENPLAPRLIHCLDSILSKILSPRKNNQADIIKNFTRINGLTRVCAFVKHHRRTVLYDKIISNQLERLESYVHLVLNNPEQANAERLTASIELLLTLSDFPVEKMNAILEKVSPFASSGEKAFNTIYLRKSELDLNSFYIQRKSSSTHHSARISHNGGYQVLSYLYAAKNDFDNLNRCLDSISINNPFFCKYSLNKFVTLNYLIKYGNLETNGVSNYLEKISKNKGGTIEELYRDLPSELDPYIFGRNLILELRFNTLIHYFIPSNNRDKAWDIYGNYILQRGSSDDSANLKKALYYRNRGSYAFISKRDTAESATYFQTAITIYRNLSKQFLEKKNEYGQKNFITFLDASDRAAGPNPFLNFLVKNNISQLYQVEEEINSLRNYLFERFYEFDIQRVENCMLSPNEKDMYYQTVQFAKNTASINNGGNWADENMLNLILLNKALHEDDSVQFSLLYKMIDLKKTFSEHTRSSKEAEKFVVSEIIKNIAHHFALKGRIDDSFKTLNLMEPPEKRNCLIDICFSLQSTGPIENSFLYMDSLFLSIKKDRVFGLKLFDILGMIGTTEINGLAMLEFKDLNDQSKPIAMLNFIRGIASIQLYHKAKTYIPGYTSSQNELMIFNEILHVNTTFILANQREGVNNLETMFNDRYEKPKFTFTLSNSDIWLAYDNLWTNKYDYYDYE